MQSGFDLQNQQCLPSIAIVGTNTEGITPNMYREDLSKGCRITLSNEKYC